MPYMDPELTIPQKDVAMNVAIVQLLPEVTAMTETIDPEIDRQMVVARKSAPFGCLRSMTNSICRPPPPSADSRMKDADEPDAGNQGTNLFVTGIHPRLSEQDVTQLFDKYGEVESCSIMLDPHTKESRGFGFVKMVTPEQADAAKEGLQGAQIEGRTLSIEKARRGKPRSPTPGKYFGPPKRGESLSPASQTC